MSPYVHEDYRDILRAFFSTKKARSGSKSEFAKALSIKTSYLSQVLSDSAHLTPEQIYLTCRYFDWGEPETEYMLLCAQKDKCKDAGLKAFYLTQLRKLKNRATTTRSQIFQDSEASSKAYYRNWLIPAVHKWVLSFGPASREDLFASFNESRTLVDEAVDCLLDLGLLQIQNDILTATNMDVKLPEAPALVERYYNDCRRYALGETAHSQGGQITRLIDSQGLSASSLEKVIQENFKALKAGTENALYMLNVDLIPVSRK